MQDYSLCRSNRLSREMFEPIAEDEPCLGDDSKESKKGNWVGKFIVLMVLTILPFLMYHTVASCFFIGDDLPTIERYSIERHNAWSEALTIMPNGFWRPTGNLLFVVVDRCFGLLPSAFHSASVGLHTIVGLLVFYMAAKTFGTGIGIVVSALFIVHPAGFFSVHQIANVSDQFVALFLLLSILSLEAYFRQRRLLFLVGFWLCVLLTLTSKESGVIVLPVILVLILRRDHGLPRNRIWSIMAPLLLLSILRVAFVVYCQATYAGSYSGEGRMIHSIPSLVRQFADYSMSAYLPWFHLMSVPFFEFTPSFYLLRDSRAIVVVLLLIAALSLSRSHSLLESPALYFLLACCVCLPNIPLEGDPQGRFLYPALPFACASIGAFLKSRPRKVVLPVSVLLVSIYGLTLLWSPTVEDYKRTCNEVEQLVVRVRAESREWSNGDRILIANHPHPGAEPYRWAYCQLLFNIFLSGDYHVLIHPETVDYDRFYVFSDDALILNEGGGEYRYASRR